MEEVQRAYAWQQAIKLSMELVRICEEFIHAENNVLVGHLRQSVIDVPATIAVDLKYGRMATMEPVIRLATQLELVHRIYPAIDTGDAPEQLEQLIARMSSDGFSESEPVEEDFEDEEDDDMPGHDGRVYPAGGTVVSRHMDQMSRPARVISVSPHDHNQDQ